MPLLVTTVKIGGRWIANDRIAAGTETAWNAFIKAKALEDSAELRTANG
jgi:hypothetical protein